MIAFLAMAVSGVLLYVGPHGPVARNWTFLGLGKRDWNHLHMTTATLFLVAFIFHMIWNWSMFWGYIKKKAEAGVNLKIELLAAFLIGAIVIGGTIYDAPPFSLIIKWNQTLRKSWGGEPGRRHGEPGPGGERSAETESDATHR
jgi:hypothetical protein